MSGEAFRRTDLPVAARAEDLLGRLSREERIALLHQAMPAIDRLGIARFHTGCEALHGLAWVGTATVFPQPVGLAAAWDPELVTQVAEVVATEVRAKRADGANVGLNVWAPVVNTLRHPLWGRNEEGYSEDPHYTGQLGAAYSRGLRGDHERVWKTVPSLKHFLGYSNETDRSATSSEMSLRTLHEEELPAFRDAIEQKVAGSMMLAYNQVNGVPAHTQPELVAEARTWTDESIAIVSDAGAPTFLVTIQGAQPDQVHGAAALVRSGMDSFTDNDQNAQPTIDYVTAALAQGLLSEAEVDQAVQRLLEMRVRTGEFDGDADPYAGIVAADLDTPAARELAREAVARQVVVLRNDAAVLPLTEPASIAVVGPMADLVLTDWYSGTPPYMVGIAQGIAERYPQARVEVVTGADTVALRAASGYVAASADGARVDAVAAERTAATLFDVTDWGDGILTLRSGASGRLLTGGAWPMRADADRVGGWVVQESFRRHVHADGTWSLLHLGSGRWVRVVREVGLLVAEAVTLDDAARFEAETVTTGLEVVATAATAADVVIVAVGNDPHLSGRETADRPHLLLPTALTDVWRAARGVNPRSILTIVSSFPYVLAEAGGAETVVWSSHGGQELGHGVADVLSGDREPVGRLAQSWPADPDQAGDLFDYDTQRQQATYRHQPEPYAFAFGHGLTYGEVTYEAVALDADSVPAPAPTHRHPALAARPDEHVVTATVSVRNTGDRAVDELVQVYALAPELPIAAPRRLLLGYARVRLEPGEARAVAVPFAVERLAVWDGALRLPGAPADWLHEGALRVQPGTYEIAAGPSADELVVTAPLSVA
ncbi:glycoside hydrolase family 3 C-terminal domain-containing protein [Microbacterium sp. W1N]|uniref:glycoside hydrolase family 3 C-terminal domain-containing protein n=1 Tax=Microbacterium festucae TaxID=2977531 RepID=UPI0021BF94C1|nr:glycoside hydrolase family 3 C-terminal domain-containing protein [Microbacterium festucae]MCT9821294.1 glycoside hydrolase family 3 C-terminal domain-containing protein [Microbacterium festucae]